MVFLSLFLTVHRDLKPANLLVSGKKLCIADLGQARMIETKRDEISLKGMYSK